MDKKKLEIALEFMQQEEQDLLNDLTHLRKRIASIRQKLSLPPTQQSPNAQVDMELDNNTYDSEWAWVDKVSYFLNREKRFLHAREIQELIQSYEPSESKTILQRRVSSALARLKKDDAIINYKAGKTNHSVFWGSPKWLDENGNPKPNHKYDENYLKEKKPKRRIIE